MKQKIHYAGGVNTPRMKVLPGWAACCYGRRAERIRAQGNHTLDVDEVTCFTCLRVMAKDKSIPKRGESRDQQ